MVNIKITNQKIILIDEKDPKKRIIYGKLHADLKKNYSNGYYEALVSKDKITIKRRL